VLDAKHDQIFTATFANDGRSPPALREPARLDSLAAVLGRVGRPVHVIGEGIPYHEKFIPTGDTGIFVTPPELWRARAAAVAEVGSAMARRGEWTEPERLAPIYVRKPEAEEKYYEKHGGPSHP
jgi:tRNA A37 threonylcarbamoyladenosine modification protein TsaB